jgi:argonaute-like protein implicated in RNA metabolism and viral defense
LALNIYAKAGNVPWVLDEAMTGVDLFIGLSSSQIRRGARTVRMMGYVNVFDSYGRWRFYQGDTVAFDFGERLRHYSELVKNSVAAYRAESHLALESVAIHLTKQFAKEEREVLAEAVRAVAPAARVTFIWVNPHHHLRLYDLSEGTGGRIRRSTYLRDEPGRLYLATTGENVFGQPGMGTPVPLQLTVWTDPEAEPPLREVGQQVLSLTRLNWGSSRSFCHEPITSKFAGEIARLMNVFMEDPGFSVNPSLRGTPWFL